MTPQFQKAAQFAALCIVLMGCYALAHVLAMIPFLVVGL